MSIYNLNLIEEMTAGDKEFMRSMAEAFIEEIPCDVIAMNEAIENENAPLTYQIVHKMKPNLKMFGLELSMEIEKLEAWANSDLNKEQIMPHALQITQTINQVAKELKTDFHL